MTSYCLLIAYDHDVVISYKIVEADDEPVEAFEAFIKEAPDATDWCSIRLVPAAASGGVPALARWIGMMDQSVAADFAGRIRELMDLDARKAFLDPALRQAFHDFLAHFQDGWKEYGIVGD